MTISFHEGELDVPDVAALLALHFVEMRGHSPADACHVLPAASLRSPLIRFFSARSHDGDLLGVGAFKLLNPSHGEIKSMRTSPAALGSGIGGALLSHLMEQARTQGIVRLSLETGSTPAFAAALRLYEREGFTPCGPFADYPASPFTQFFTRKL